MRTFLVAWLYIYGNLYFTDLADDPPVFILFVLVLSMPLAVIQDFLEIRRGILSILAR